MFNIYIKYYMGDLGVVKSSEKLIMSVPFMDETPAIANPILNKSWDAIGSFDFELYQNSPYFNAFMHMKTIVRVEYDGTTIFYGRVLAIHDTLFGVRKIKCEDGYSFLNDVYYPGQPDTKRAKLSLNAYVKSLINYYNDHCGAAYKRFVIDEIPGQYADGTSANKKIAEETRKHGKAGYDTIKSLLDNLASNYGGHWMTQYNPSDNRIHISWFKNYFRSRQEIFDEASNQGLHVMVDGSAAANPNAGNLYVRERGTEIINSMDDDWMQQAIVVGENVLDLNNSLEIDNVFTRVIPLGSTNKGETVTITDYVHNNSKWGKNYISVSELSSLIDQEELFTGYHTKRDYDNAEENYGVIYKTVSFSNAATAGELWKYALDWIKENYLGVVANFSIKAIDKYLLYNSPYKHLVGDQITVVMPSTSEEALEAKVMTIKSINYDIENPENWQYTIGYPSELLDHEYGEKRTTGNSTAHGSNPFPTTQPDSNPQFTAHSSIQQSINFHYGTETSMTYKNVQARKIYLAGAGTYMWVVGLFTHNGNRYAVGVDSRGLYTFRYNSLSSITTPPTPDFMISGSGSGGNFTVATYGFTADAFASACDAGTVVIDANAGNGNATTMTALGGDEVPTETANNNGTTTPLPAGSTTANDAPAVIINDTVTYVDSQGQTQTQSGFITVRDIQLNDIPSFKTDYAQIKKLVVEDLKVEGIAYINNLQANEIVSGTYVRASDGYFNSINIVGNRIGTVSVGNALATIGLQKIEDGKYKLMQRTLTGTDMVEVGIIEGFNGATSLRGVWSSADSSANLNKFTVSADKGKITPIEIRLYNHFGNYAGQDTQGNPSGEFTNGFRVSGSVGNRTFMALYEVYGNPTDDRISPTGRRSYIQDLMIMNANSFTIGSTTLQVNPYAQGLADGVMTAQLSTEWQDQGSGYANVFVASITGNPTQRKSITVTARFGYYATVGDSSSWVAGWNMKEIDSKHHEFYGTYEAYADGETRYSNAADLICTENGALNNPYKQGLLDGNARATVTITGVWSGDAMSFTATPSVDGSNAYSITPNVIFEGNGTANFSAGIQAFDATIHGKKYLNLTPTYNKRNSKIDVIPVGGSAIASISIGELYSTGLTDANVSGYWAGQKFTYQNANNASKKGIITITSEVKSVNSGEYAQINAACTGSVTPSGGIIWTKYVYLELDVENKIVKAKIGDDRTSAVSPTSISVQDVYDAGAASAPQKGIGAVSWAGNGTATIGLSTSSQATSRSISLTADNVQWGEYTNGSTWTANSDGNVAKRVIKDANANNAVAYTAYVDATSRYNKGHDAGYEDGYLDSYNAIWMGWAAASDTDQTSLTLGYGVRENIYAQGKSSSTGAYSNKMYVTIETLPDRYGTGYTAGQNSKSAWWGYILGTVAHPGSWPTDSNVAYVYMRTTENGTSTDTRITTIDGTTIYNRGFDDVIFYSITYDSVGANSTKTGNTLTVPISNKTDNTARNVKIGLTITDPTQGETYTDAAGGIHKSISVKYGNTIIMRRGLNTFWNNAGQTSCIRSIAKEDIPDGKTAMQTITTNGSYRIRPGYTKADTKDGSNSANDAYITVNVSKGTSHSDGVWGLTYKTGLDGQGQSNGTTKQTKLYYWDPNRTKYYEMGTGYWYLRSTYIQPQTVYT